MIDALSCSTPSPSQVIRKGEVSCCWTCTPCKENEFVFDEYTCRACELGTWPTDDLTGQSALSLGCRRSVEEKLRNGRRPIGGKKVAYAGNKYHDCTCTVSVQEGRRDPQRSLVIDFLAAAGRVPSGSGFSSSVLFN